MAYSIFIASITMSSSPARDRLTDGHRDRHHHPGQRAGEPTLGRGRGEFPGARVIEGEFASLRTEPHVDARAVTEITRMQAQRTDAGGHHALLHHDIGKLDCRRAVAAGAHRRAARVLQCDAAALAATHEAQLHQGRAVGREAIGHLPRIRRHTRGRQPPGGPPALRGSVTAPSFPPPR